MATSTTKTIVNILAKELISLEGIQGQHPESGAGLDESVISSYLDQYTNRIFGSPFQFIDTVDKRYDSINKYLGNEYLRNITLNSPILHIKPGMPYYTGGATESAIAKSLLNIYVGTNGKMSFVQNLLMELAKNTIFSKGSKLQKRMFGFRETYYQYMQHVNYMCRSTAVFLNLTSSGNDYPDGVYKLNSTSTTKFSKMDWSSYRFMSKSKVMSPTDELKKLGAATLIGKAAKSAKSAVTTFLNNMKNSDDKGLLDITSGDSGTSTKEETETAIIDVLSNKICSVLFMVEPVQFEETLTNNTKDSVIESTLDSLNSSIGSELAFITGSKVDLGMIEGITDFLGNTVETAAQFVGGLVEPLTGGFTTNLFNGALQSVKGQKMIYPKIYESSNSEMNYTFTVNLSTPYGDPYNYYMNIVVPLLHLVALAAPRMVTSNATKSPYLVQAFIPGMCTCQLGIIQNMVITKNPNANRVSVNGFPLDVKVTFTVQELYNALSISPANDPASFLFNETLNDYMANLAGLQPSIDTYSNQRVNAFEQLEQYFSSGEYVQDLANTELTKVENFFNPFTGR